ncbi:hypothetical protein GCM10028807_42120 [Spirosoma daeguense]
MTPAYIQEAGSLPEALERLRRYITDVPASFSTLSESDLKQHDPGKWSKKEILGHLIDSALHNLKRFTEAQFSDDTYLVVSYNQNQLVLANQYQTRPLAHLLHLWSSLNTQILYVAESISEPIRAQAITFGSSAQTYTLGWLIEDYVAHLEHHLKSL